MEKGPVQGPTFHCDPGGVRGERLTMKFHLAPVLTSILLVD